MITAPQCRGARGLLNRTKDDLIKAAQVGIAAVRQFEAGNAEPRHSTLAFVTGALGAAGIVFIVQNGGGADVRLRIASSADKGARGSDH